EGRSSRTGWAAPRHSRSRMPRLNAPGAPGSDPAPISVVPTPRHRSGHPLGEVGCNFPSNQTRESLGAQGILRSCHRGDGMREGVYNSVTDLIGGTPTVVL